MRPESPDSSATYRRYLAAVVTYHLAAATRLGLGATDYQAHSLLGLHGRLTTGELAGFLGLSPSATTRVVDRLVSLGLAVRETDPADRRRTVVTATDTPVAGLDQQLSEVRDLVAEAFADLDEPGRAALTRYFERATDGYREATARLGVTPDRASDG